MRVTFEQVTHPHQSFRFLRFETDAFRGEPHRHRHVELTWIEAGEGMRFVGDNAQPFQAGDLVLIGSETPHCWVSTPGSGPAVATVVQFLPELLAAPGLPELAQVAALAERAAVGLAIQSGNRPPITAQLVKLRTARGVGRLTGLMEIFELLAVNEAALVQIARTPMRIARSAAGSASSARRIDRIFGWMHREMSGALCVEDAARIARITPGAFSRYFRHEVGKTFTQYVNDLRCSEACMRLLRTDKAVAVIAAECGFATLSNFNRQFRLRVGSTPRDFRCGRTA